MSKPRVEITQRGRGGGITYREGASTIAFTWEFAMSPALALIFGPASKSWDKEFPWAAGRQAAIFEFVAREVVRQKAKGGHFEVELGSGNITILQSSAPVPEMRAHTRGPSRPSRPGSSRTETSAAETEVVRPGRHKRSAAFQKFLASFVSYSEHWRDGQMYDITALKKLSAAERDIAVDLLRAGDVTWREVAALAEVNTPEARDALEAATRHQVSIDTRLAAAECLNQQGRFKDLNEFLARQIRLLDRPANGLHRALMLAKRYPNEKVKQALLWASYNTTECAPHCAKLLLALTRTAKEPHGADLEQMLSKLGMHNSYFDHKAAFDELCRRVRMEFDPSAAD